MKKLNLLLKPSSGMCNLNCSYCFYHDIVEKREQQSYGFMTEETLEQVIKKSLSAAEEECTIAFQGGEPTLIGLDFYKKAVEFQKKYNVNRVRIHNAIQTNGTLLDDEWAEFLAQNHFLVGISLDGIKETHDCNRLDAHQQGTFSKVMQITQMLEKHHVDFNILTVVNRQTAKRINKIYSFYKKNNLRYLQFIPCLDPFEEEPGLREYSLTPKEYGQFLKRLFDLWYLDFMAGNMVSIRQFENYIEMLLGYPPEACGMSGICGFQNVVEADGGVYPCDFYVLDRYLLANMNDGDFPEIEKKREEIGFVKESMQLPEKCRSCKFAPICRNGCKRYRLLEPDGSYGVNYFCESYHDFFSYSIERLQQMARMIATNQKKW